MPYIAKASFVLSRITPAPGVGEGQGVKVGTHGPLPQAVMEAYQEHLDTRREE
jgi:hypothetical protein